MKNIMKKTIPILLILILSLSLLACANQTDDDDTVLHIGIAGSISTLDVNQEAGILNYYIAALVNEGLIAIDNEGRAIPALATSWDTEDYTTWTFTLREDAVFHDDSPVTIEDIIWSIERASDPEESLGVAIYFLDFITEITKVDDTNLKIVLQDPRPSFIWALSNVGGLLVSPRAWGESVASIGSPQDLLNGSGPFQVTEFAPGSHVTLEATDTWWGGTASIPSIRFEIIGDEATRLLAFTGGNIDFALNIPIEQSEQWSQVEGAQVEFYAERSYFGLTLDVTVEPFNDVLVRQAIAQAVNAAGIVNTVLGGHAEVATAVTPPEQFASAISVAEARTLLSGVTHFTYDLEAAASSLQSADIENFATTIYFPGSHPSVGQASLVIADSLGQLGLDVTVTEIPLEQWLAAIGNSGQGINWMIYSATTPHPPEIASWLFDARGTNFNPANFENEEIAGLIANIQTIAPEDGIADLVLAHDLIQEQAVYVPVWWGQAAIAFNSNITVEHFTSYTLLSQNWSQQFSFVAD